MFEGKQIQSVFDTNEEDAALLRELRWSDLVTQLAAMRDLRAVGSQFSERTSTAGRFASLSPEYVEKSGQPSLRRMQKSPTSQQLTNVTAAQSKAFKDQKTQ